MDEFKVTQDGELDLGLDRAAPAAAELAAPTTAAAAADDGWACYEVDPDWEPADYGDPGTDPDGFEAWLAGLPADIRADYLDGAWTGEGESIPAGFLHHERGRPVGTGFAAGGVLDALPPGPLLARALDDATADGHAGLGESELIGVLCATRRMSAWAAAAEAAAVLALARRRAAQSAIPGSSRLPAHVTDEIAAALTLTGRAAARLLEVASGLARMPAVHEALQRGEIDWPKACAFADELAVLDDDTLAQAIAGRFLGRAGAGGWTTGQLRAALRRAVLSADPDAAARRRAEARKDAAVRTFDEASGNSGLAGRELPPAEVLTADARLTALATWLQRRGAAGTISQLRATVYTALLNGRPLTTLLDHPAPGDATISGSDAERRPDHDDRDIDAAGSADHHERETDTAASADHRERETDTAASADPGARHIDSPDGSAAQTAARDAEGWPAVTGTIHLTMPMASFLGGGQAGEVAGHGPIDAATSRQLAAMLSASAATRWCLTLTGPDGRAASHACARRGPGRPDDRCTGIRWASDLRTRLQLLETAPCGHGRQSGSYQPPPSLRHLIQTRQRTCSFPGCRRPAVRCDLDHTQPFDQGGLTCECNLAPLCRKHHQAKQAPGWHLDQPEPGRMTWRTPSGRVYETVGDPY